MRILTTFILTLMIASSSWSQIKFVKLFSNNGADFGHGVVQLEDSSYVITGSSSSFGNAPSQAFLLKLDSMGNYMWSNSYGGGQMEEGRRVLYKQNFGFFICGFTSSYGNGGFDYYMAKVDENANLEWERSYGDYGWEKVHDAALTRDTGVIMVGETSSNLTDNKDIYIVRTDKNGDTLWTKTFGGPGDDYASCITKYQDSMFYIGGQYWLEDSLLTKGMFMYLKDDGTIMWQDTLQNIAANYENYRINDIAIDGTRAIACGGTYGPSKDSLDFFFYAFDDTGTMVDRMEVGNPGDEEHMHIAVENGGANTLFLATYTQNQFTGVFGVVSIIQNFASNFAWNGGFTMGHVGPDISNDLITTSDGGAVAVGYTTGQASGGNEAFIVKIGPGLDFPSLLLDEVTENLVVVHELGDIADMTIYPNPASTHIQVDTDESGYSYIRLFDTYGKLVAKESIQLHQSIDVSHLPAGSYILEVSGENLPSVRKKVIVKQ